MDQTVNNTPAAWDARARTAASSWEAAMWSERGQQARFDAVLDLLLGYSVEPEWGFSLLDYGCGTGDFCLRLPPWVDYTGLDWSPEMRARARREHGAWIVDELSDDLVFDDVVCIGPFNLSDGWSKEATWETVEELWTMHTRRSLVVSLFRDTGRTPSGMLAYSPTDVLELVERLGSPPFLLQGDHLPNDLILRVTRDRHGAPAELPAGDVRHLQGQGG